MTINVKFKSLIAVALFSVCSGIVSANTDKNTSAPKASAAERKISIWDMPYLEKAFIDTAPEDRKDDLSVGVLGVDGGNENIIIKMANEIAENKEGKFDSVLISHKNKLIFESYYGRGRINLPHMQASVTKSYLSIAIGRAIQLGYLTMADLNKPVVSFIKDIDLGKVAEGAEKITLHQAMNMRSGGRVSDESQKLIMDNSMNIKGENITQQFLQLILSSEQSINSTQKKQNSSGRNRRRTPLSW